MALAVAAEDDEAADGDLDAAPSRSARLSVDAEPPDELPVYGNLGKKAKLEYQTLSLDTKHD